MNEKVELAHQNLKFGLSRVISTLHTY